MKMFLLEPDRFDNHAEHYEHIGAEPLASAMGAEITGVDLSDLSDAAFAEIERALYRHKMIFFRDQRLTHADQEAFTLRFGEFGVDAYTKGVDGHENVQPVIKEADARTKMIFGTGWHTDSPFLPQPPAISMLYAHEVPPFGGDTIWANCALAYAMLSERMRAMLEGLKVHMSMADVLATSDKAGGSSTLSTMRERGAEEIERRVTGSLHPLVRTHPVTGERSLYVDQTYTAGIDGLTEAEAAPLLDFLVRHITQSAFTCRLRWHAGTLAVWDNRLCLHQAYNDHDGFRREMYRTTVMGEVPA